MAPGAETTKDGLLNRSEVFCMLPWVSLNIQPDGNVHPCCIQNNMQPLGSLRRQTMEEIWNAPRLRAMRRNMLAGAKSPQCEKCYAVEKSKGASVRTSMNSIFSHHFPVVEATESDGAVKAVNLAYLDVRFSNICNFRCHYCSIEQSTGWYNDHKLLFGEPKHPLLSLSQDSPGFERELESLLPKVETIYFSGGEPLLSTEHHRILKALAEKGLTHIRLVYSTNLSVLDFRGTDFPRLWNRFETVRVMASLDAMGKRGEYIRKNQDWETTLRNRERMMEVCPKVEFNINATLTVMNALHLPDFHREWLERGRLEPEEIYISFLFSPEEYRVQILPDHLKKKVAGRYEAHIEYLRRKYGPRAEKAERQFRSAVDFMRVRDLSGHLGRFRERIRCLDEVRGERFGEVFPELAELVA